MKKLTIILSIFSALLLILCFFFAYMWIDRSITLTYMELSFEEKVSSNERFARIILKEWKGKSTFDIEKRIQTIAKDISNNENLIKWEDDSLWFNNIQFIFEKDKLIGIDNVR
jgi:putative signal peptide protein